MACESCETKPLDVLFTEYADKAVDIAPIETPQGPVTRSIADALKADGWQPLVDRAGMFRPCEACRGG